VEWDGAQHHRATAHAADNVRTEAYADLGMLVVRVSAPDWRDKRRLRHRLVTAHRRAAALPLDARRWMLEKPPCWGGCRAASLWE
jgi:very-short-patch-repair endonuclease